MIRSRSPNCWMCEDVLPSSFVSLIQRCHSEPIWTICLECYERNSKHMYMRHNNLLYICAICDSDITLDSMFTFTIYVIENNAIKKHIDIHETCCYKHIHSPPL